METQTATSQAAAARPKDAVARLAGQYRDVADRLPGASSAEVRAWREAALEAAVAQGMPHRRIEAWKFTDLRSLVSDFSAPAVSEAEAGALPDFTLGGALSDAYTAVFVNGRFDAARSSVQNAAGVVFTTLADDLVDPETVAQGFDATPASGGQFIDAISTAFASGGVSISIQSGVKLDKPLHIVSLTTASEGALYAARDTIAVLDDAELTLVESHISTGAHQSFSSSRMTIGRGAKVKHLRLVRGGAGLQLGSAAVSLLHGAEYDAVHLVEGGALTRYEANIAFTASGGRAHFNGGMLLRGREHGDFTLTVDHAAPACESREFVRAVLDGEARGVFQGKAIVQPGAQKTDGHQLASGLLLSETAEFDAKPELEIYADDVKCGHGATSGELDEEALFYLRSRGLAEDEARSLLILAFIGEITEQIEDERVREAITTRVSRWLTG